MKTTLCIMTCKFVTLACKIFHKVGTVFPGHIALKINKNVLANIKYPEKVIVVTGSSGKGSTTEHLVHIYEKAGKKVVWNSGESNVKTAITTTILNNTKIFSHKLKCDVLIIEADERYLAKTFSKGIINDLVITNITRDQPTRNVNPDVIFDQIMLVVEPSVHLFINADDPIVNKIKLYHSGKITTYGIGNTIYSTENKPNYAQDAAYCPKCHTKIEYSLYHYGNFGIYNCPNCKFGRGKVDYEVEDVNFNDGTLNLHGDTYKINFKVFYALYYTVAALSVAIENGISNDALDLALNKEPLPTHRFKEYNLLDRKVITVDSKTENAPSFIQSLEYIVRQNGKKTIIMGFDSVSRRYSKNDLSWLWDIPYELLNNSEVDKIFCIGRFRYDVAVRTHYAGVSDDKLVIVDDLETLVDRIINESTGNIYTTFYHDLQDFVIRKMNEKNEEHNEQDN